MSDGPNPGYPPDAVPGKGMTVGRMLSELAGEPVATAVELAIVDHAGALLYTVPMLDNDAWWIRGSNVVRFVGRLPREWTEPEAVPSEAAAGEP